MTRARPYTTGLLVDALVIAALAFVVGCAVLFNKGAVPVEPERDVPDWVATRAITSALAALAVGLEREIAACVVSETPSFGHRVEIPGVVSSERARVSADRCPPEAVARWHNHPISGECRLSHTDIVTTLKQGHPWVAVSTSDGTLCWWSLEQVEQAEDARVLLRLPEQVDSTFVRGG